VAQPDPPYKIEFYADEHGRKPVLQWIERKLSVTQRRALVLAIEEVLAHEGLDVVESEFGKPTSVAGVHEFRLRQDENEMAARVESRVAARVVDSAAEEAGDEEEEDQDSCKEAEGNDGDQGEPEATPRKKRGERVFLRVFFHAHGDKVILLLAGYDKGKNPSSRHESKVIGDAGARLTDWRRQQQVAKKAKKRKP
jgi:hypothetical protein